MTTRQFQGYLKGNVTQNTYGVMNTEPKEDLQKAQWYLARLLETYDYEGENQSKNQHRYNNQTSRWCDQNNVPYQRNGLFGPTTVEDQVTGNTFQTYGVFDLPEGVKAEQIFNEGDWLVAEYQQGYIRCKVTGFSPRVNLIVDRFTTMHGVKKYLTHLVMFLNETLATYETAVTFGATVQDVGLPFYKT